MMHEASMCPLAHKLGSGGIGVKAISAGPARMHAASGVAHVDEPVGGSARTADDGSDQALTPMSAARTDVWASPRRAPALQAGMRPPTAWGTHRWPRIAIIERGAS